MVLVVLALIRKVFVAPSSKYHLKAFPEAVPALVVGYVVALVGPGEAAASNTEFESPPADVVQGGDLLGPCGQGGRGEAHLRPRQP